MRKPRRLRLHRTIRQALRNIQNPKAGVAYKVGDDVTGAVEYTLHPTKGWRARRL